MTTPFVGEIRLFSGNFAPHFWSFCDGTTLAISHFQQLYSIIGTTYGGNGQDTFSLPDMRGRIPLHHGTGHSLTPQALGHFGGEEAVSLTTNQMPPHSHLLAVSTVPPADTACDGYTLGKGRFYEDPADAPQQGPMLGETIGATGTNKAHQNMMPVLALNFIIALKGIYPSRN
ncbi:MAG: phage tail protein [Rhodospirillaceae bacterium]